MPKPSLKRKTSTLDEWVIPVSHNHMFSEDGVWPLPRTAVEAIQEEYGYARRHDVVSRIRNKMPDPSVVEAAHDNPDGILIQRRSTLARLERAGRVAAPYSEQSLNVKVSPSSTRSTTSYTVGATASFRPHQAFVKLFRA